MKYEPSTDRQDESRLSPHARHYGQTRSVTNFPQTHSLYINNSLELYSSVCYLNEQVYVPFNLRLSHSIRDHIHELPRATYTHGCSALLLFELRVQNFLHLPILKCHVLDFDVHPSQLPGSCTFLLHDGPELDKQNIVWVLVSIDKTLDLRSHKFEQIQRANIPIEANLEHRGGFPQSGLLKMFNLHQVWCNTNPAREKNDVAVRIKAVVTTEGSLNECAECAWNLLSSSRAVDARGEPRVAPHEQVDSRLFGLVVDPGHREGVRRKPADPRNRKVHMLSMFELPWSRDPQAYQCHVLILRPANLRFGQTRPYIAEHDVGYAERHLNGPGLNICRCLRKRSLLTSASQMKAASWTNNKLGKLPALQCIQAPTTVISESPICE